MNDFKRQPRILKATRLLQSKVGSGSVDAKKIKRSQAIIDNNTVDFEPLARQYLEALIAVLKQARDDLNDGKPGEINAIRDPVMEIKANAPMFNYGMIGSMAKIMLDFLENIEGLDKDVLDVVEAFTKTLNLVLKNQMKGDGGTFGQELESELEAACQRYFAKNGDPLYAGADDVFFID